MIVRRNLVRRLAGIALVVGVFSGVAKADLVYNLTVMTNGNLPIGPAPYARATFKTTGVNSVQLTMENLGVDSGMEIIGWYFNVNLSAADILGMTFTHNSGQIVNAVTKGSNHSKGIDSSSKAGFFDIVFDFPPPPGNDKFSPNETSVWTITGNGLTESSFASVSAPDGSYGGWGSVVRIQSYENVLNETGASGSIGDGEIPQDVPEPFTMALMGGAAIAGYRRMKRKNSK
jgi:hypothetical protein